MNTMLSRAVLAALATGAAVGAADAATIKPIGHAAIPTGYADITSVPSTNILWIGGSTAIDAALKYWAFNTTDTSVLCSSGSTTVYASTSTPKFTAVVCSAGTAFTNSGISAGTLVAYVKEDNAGSLNGIAAVQNKTFGGSYSTLDGRLNFPAISSLSYVGTAAPTSGGGCYGTTKSGTGIQTYLNLTCTGATSAATPTASTGAIYPELGFADVEGSLFGIDTSAPVAGGAPITSASTVQVVFGVAVNVGLYHALQAVQGLTQDDAVAHMPSLSRGEVAALFGGYGPYFDLYQNTSGASVATQSVVWGQASGKCWNGTATVTSCGSTASAVQAASQGVGAPTPYICRRGNTSGSEKTAEIFFDDLNCASNTSTFLTASNNALTTIQGACSAWNTDGCSWSTSFQGSTGNLQVFPGNGTGDLLDCLVGHDTAGEFAIGFASVDNLSGSDQSKSTRQDFRYIRVDGVVPSVENAAAGKYPFIAQSFSYAPPAAASWSATNQSGAVANAILTLMTNGAQGIGSLGSVVGVNAASKMVTQGFDGGVLVIPSATNLPNNATSSSTAFASNPVSAITKAPSGSTNNCVRPVLYNGSQTQVPGGNFSWAGPN